MITNKDRFPEVDFLPDPEIRIIGLVGSDKLAIVGFEQGTDSPVVAYARTNKPAKERLFAIPLYELLSHNYEEIRIPEDLGRGTLSE